MRLTLAFCLFGALAAPAQDTEPAMILPRPEQVYAELTAFLNLTSAQLQTLMDIDRSRRQAEQNIYNQLREKDQALNALLRAGSNDALRIGQLMVEINTLRRQLPVNGEPYRSSALKALKPEQIAKLPALSAALQLQTAAWEAVTLSLIDRQDPPVRIMPVEGNP